MQSTCQAATCDDGVQNQSETNIDCGGPACEECVCARQTDIPRAECDALYALYHATHGELWFRADNWLTPTPCTWAGVTCAGPPPSRVVSLDVADNGLIGHLPPELGNLTSLTTLWLGDNSLIGGIPAELGNLVELRNLFLGVSTVSGTIPRELGNLQRLERLWLNETQLSGPIPPELGSLPALTELRLNEARLTGTIPAQLGGLDLRILWLNENQLSGTIPETILNLSGASISLNGNLCLTAESAALATFLDREVRNWNDGCP